MGCGGSQELSEERIIQGLLDALKYAASAAVDATSAPGAFNAPEIHIPIPGDLGKVMEKCKGLPGIGSLIEDLEAKINQSAERACAGVLGVFTAAIDAMKFNDAKAILRGSPTAATEYFKANTRASLFEKFKPIVNDAMSGTGVKEVYDAIIAIYNAIPTLPFGDGKEPVPAMDFCEYICNKGLDGLFLVLGQKESLVRSSPNLRNTEAMKEVFASTDKKQ